MGMPPIPGPGMDGIGRGIMPGGRIIRDCPAACMGGNKTPREQQIIKGAAQNKRRIILFSSSGDYHMNHFPSSLPLNEDRKRAAEAGADQALHRPASVLPRPAAAVCNAADGMMPF
jgi:hypothetical protein